MEASGSPMRAHPPGKGDQVPPWLRRVGGLLFIAVGGLLMVLSWREARLQGTFHLKGALLGPAFAVLGMGLVLFPGYREERRARGEELEGLTGLALLTPRWWGILVLALLAGGMHGVFLYYH